MSSNKQEYTDLDLAEDEFFAEFEEKDEKPSEIGQNKAPSLAQPLSSKSNFFKPHDFRSVTSAMNDILAKDCAPPHPTNTQRTVLGQKKKCPIIVCGVWRYLDYCPDTATILGQK